MDLVSAAAQAFDGLAGTPGPVVRGGCEQVHAVQAMKGLEAEAGQVPLADVVGDSLGRGDVPVLGVRADDELFRQRDSLRVSGVWRATGRLGRKRSWRPGWWAASAGSGAAVPGRAGR